MFDTEYTFSEELNELMKQGKVSNPEVEELVRPTDQEVTRDLVEAFRNDYRSWNRKS